MRGWLARRGLGVGGLVPAVLLALAPKCFLCVAAYLTAGAALRFGGPELCGAPAGGAGHWTMWLPALGLAVGAVGFFAFGRRRRA
jgi:LPXTG-motif cell wall-anchored protein